MFKSLESRINRRFIELKKKSTEQAKLEKTVQRFLNKEFGQVAEIINFKVALDKKTLRLWFNNKTAANEAALRMASLTEELKVDQIKVKAISIE